MLSGKFLFTLIGLIVAILSICNLNYGQNTLEGFWGNGNRAYKVVKTIKTQGKDGNYFMKAVPDHIGHLSDSNFIKRPQFSSNISPRFTNADLGANIRYNMPDINNMASNPHDPLTSFGDMVEEKYTHNSNGCISSGKESDPYSGGNHFKGGYANGNFNKVTEQVYDQSSYPEVTSSLPVGNMTTYDSEGTMSQHVTYNQFMSANPQNRGRSQACQIRGDLHIIPTKQQSFHTYPNVALDLHPGALGVMGGLDGPEHSVSKLITMASGGIQSPMDEFLSMGPQYKGNYSSAGKDIQISAY